MGAKNVDFERLAAAMRDYSFAYLLTVDDAYRVHTVTVKPELYDHILDVGLIGGRTRTNLASRNSATVLWPPSQPDDYSLIVDGRVEIASSSDQVIRLTIVPTRALLHRNAAPDSAAAAAGYLHDCVVLAEA